MIKKYIVIGITLLVTTTASSCGTKKVAQLAPSGWTLDGCQLIWHGRPTGATEKRCYTDSNWRPVSTLSECGGQEKNGALCYEPCKSGFHGAGPICWQDCPAGYSDDGAFCRRNAEIFGSDNSRCPWYDKCGLTFARGCSTCPEGFHNDGCTCRKDVHIFAKQSFFRGVGSFMSCPAGKQQLGLLCYGDCPAGYVADGVRCNATQQTCEDIPVLQPPDTSELRRFCFTLNDPQSFVQPCLPVSVVADTEEHAKQMAQCQCVNCTVNPVNCEAFDKGTACR
jgi:hypothetical protein